ncbi:MAG: GGDEF domain-containing protein [Cyanobacteria bacterium P01_C01_bin.89]
MSNFPENRPASLSRFAVASDPNLPTEDASEVDLSSAPPEAPLGDPIPTSPVAAETQEINPQGAEEDTPTKETQPGDLLPSLKGTRILVYSLPFRSQRSPDKDWVPNPGLAPSENSAQMIRQFKRWGYEIDWVTQQQKCLEQCDKRLPSALILISSILTPDLLETCQTLVPHLGDAGPPLIVLAPFRSAPHLLNPILGMGVAEYLPYPMEADLLVQRVDRLIHLYQSTIEMRQQYSRERQLIDRLIETNALLARTQEKIQSLSSNDQLTQLPNRSGLEQRLRHEWRRLARDYETLSIITISLDDFAQFFTLYGATASDEYLRAVADTLQRGLHRPADFLARTSGDTFSVILPGTNHKGAMHVAERLVQAVRTLNMPASPHGTPFSLADDSNFNTFSGCSVNVCAGVTTRIPDPEVSSFSLLLMAEKALDQAREEGGDRAVFLPSQPSSREYHNP